MFVSPSRLFRLCSPNSFIRFPCHRFWTLSAKENEELKQNAQRIKNGETRFIARAITLGD